MQGTATTTTKETTVRLTVGISLVSLFLSGWSFISPSTRTASSAASSNGSPASSAGAERLRLQRSLVHSEGECADGRRVPRVPS